VEVSERFRVSRQTVAQLFGRYERAGELQSKVFVNDIMDREAHIDGDSGEAGTSLPSLSGER
jgi:hypothetical protein